MKTTGLSLKEAIAFNRPIKHKNWTGFYSYENGNLISLDSNQETKNQIKADEAISSDWEIKSKEHYTKEDIQRAVTALAAYIPNGKAFAIEDALFQAEKGGH